MELEVVSFDASKRRKKCSKTLGGTVTKGKPRRSLAVWFCRFPWMPEGMFGDGVRKGVGM